MRSYQIFILLTQERRNDVRFCLFSFFMTKVSTINLLLYSFNTAFNVLKERKGQAAMVLFKSLVGVVVVFSHLSEVLQ